MAMVCVHKILSKSLCLFCIWNVFSGNVSAVSLETCSPFGAWQTNKRAHTTVSQQHKRKGVGALRFQKMNAGSVEYKSTGTDERFDFQQHQILNQNFSENSLNA